MKLLALLNNTCVKTISIPVYKITLFKTAQNVPRGGKNRNKTSLLQLNEDLF